MRLTATRILGVLLFLCCASAAQARQWPPGPNGNQPDSLRVLDIQDSLLTPKPRPQVPDTVRGVGGIVTAFDAIPTGFGFFMQNRGVDGTGNQAGWTGTDCFSGSFNKKCVGLQVGDSVVVYGKIAAFQGATEIEGFDNIQATDDLIIRIINHNNTLPAYHIGTVAELKEITFTQPFAADSVREKWEDCLVQVNGPLRVVRITNPTNSANLNTNNSFLVVDDVVCPTGSVGPCDSMFVDGNTLTTLAPPPVGTIVANVRGVYWQQTRGYRIQLTSGNDLNEPSPVSLIDAYPLEDNKIRVTFDRDVSNGTNATLYSLGSFGSVLSSAAVAGNVYDLSINNGLNDGDLESVTANGFIRLSNGAVMTTPSTRNFVNGVMPISLLQAPSPDSLTASVTFSCKDVSQFVGNNQSSVRLSFRGVMTGAIGALYLMQTPGAGPRTGVSVFAPSCALVKDHQYLIAGSLQEFPVVTSNSSETEVVGTVFVQDEGLFGTIFPDIQTIAVLSDTSCDAAQNITNGEDYEEGLVKLAYVKVVSHPLRVGAGVLGRTFRVAGPNPTFTDTMSIDSTALWSTDLDSLHIVSITGHLRLIGGRWRVAPRSNADLQDHGLNVSVPNQAIERVTFAAYPNPARTSKFAFSLPHESDVELGIYDLAGRQVFLVSKARYAPGAYTKEWNGLTSSGKAAEAGVYFYRLRVGSEVHNIRGVHLN
jgi:hypothetical protein